jgi:hypothetical protein
VRVPAWRGLAARAAHPRASYQHAIAVARELGRRRLAPGARSERGVAVPSTVRHTGAWLRGWRGTALAAVVVAGLTWPPTGLLAAAGLDNSWNVGLSLALSRGIDFGRRVVFTYGPLGVVNVPRAVTPGTLVVGILGAAIIQLALATILLRSLRPRWPLIAAAPVALIALLVVVASGLPALDAIAFGAVVLTLSASPVASSRAAWTLAVAGGVFAALALLVKLNDGAAVTALVAVGLLGVPGARRTLPLAAFTLLAATVLAWLALGQPIGSLPDYLGNSYQIVVGYVDAMGLNSFGVNGEWEGPAVIASAVALATGAWFSLAPSPLRRRAALVVAVLVVVYFVAREMFVRYDAGHAAAMALLVPVALMIPWRRAQRAAGIVLAGALAVASLAVLALEGVAFGVVFSPTTRAVALVNDIGIMFSPHAEIAQGRAAIRAEDGVPPGFLPLLRGHCVNTDPDEIALLFAYPDWRWCPIGVMQSYAAYTTSLDNLDAAGYANARTGPDRVMRQLNAIDGRNPAWESPAAMLSMLCHFVDIQQGATWEVLARIPNRCGRPRLVALLHSGSDGVLSLPPDPPGMVLVARIQGLQIHASERLTTLFTRAAPRFLVVNGAVTYRVVPSTLVDGLVLDVPADADTEPPYNIGLSFGLSASTLVAEIGARSVPFSVELFGVPIAPNPARK